MRTEMALQADGGQQGTRESLGLDGLIHELSSRSYRWDANSKIFLTPLVCLVQRNDPNRPHILVKEYGQAYAPSGVRDWGMVRQDRIGRDQRLRDIEFPVVASSSSRCLLGNWITRRA